MTINFNNGRSFQYLEAFSLEKDFKDGYTRPSIEIHMPFGQTSYSEIESFLNDENITKQIVLIGNPVIDVHGDLTEAPEKILNDYTIKGKISIEDDIITFKLYRLSDIEIENRNALAAIDELLMIMEA